VRSKYKACREVKDKAADRHMRKARTRKWQEGRMMVQTETNAEKASWVHAGIKYHDSQFWARKAVGWRCSYFDND